MTPLNTRAASQKARKSAAAVLLAIGAATVLNGCFTLAAGGIAATALSVEDRRTTGIQVEDEGIEWRALNVLGEKFRDNNAVHLNVTSYNRQVLVTGEVPDDATKKQVETLVQSVANVRRVVSEVVVGQVSTLTARGGDTVITAQVKSRLVGNNVVNPIHVKVVTESGVVFLKGLVTREEGAAAVDVARTTRGVLRVVTAFEYVVVSRS
jgi:osmotically-inducible protein OsmY